MILSKLNQIPTVQLLIGWLMEQSVQSKIKDHAQPHTHFQQLEQLKESLLFSSKTNRNTQFNRSLIAHKASETMVATMEEWTTLSTMSKLLVLTLGLLIHTLVTYNHVVSVLDFSESTVVLLSVTVTVYQTP